MRTNSETYQTGEAHGGWSWDKLRQLTWQLAEEGFGPVAGAHRLVERSQHRWPKSSPEARIGKVLQAEGRKQFTAALALAAVSTVALPAGLPASLWAAHLLDARLALSIALLLGYSLDAPGVREALQEAVARPPLGGELGPNQPPGRPAQSGPGGQPEGALLNGRLVFEYAATRALQQGRALLLRHATGRWQRRLLPVVRALPAASQVVMAAFEARAMRSLARRVQLRLARLPTEAMRTSAVSGDQHAGSTA